MEEEESVEGTTADEEKRKVIFIINNGRTSFQLKRTSRQFNYIYLNVV